MMAAMAGFFPGFHQCQSGTDAMALKYSKAFARGALECR
jgi:hypothetical protein